MPVFPHVCRGLAAALLIGGSTAVWAQEAVTPADLRELLEHNRRLQEQVQAQQAQLDELRARLDAIGQREERQDRELETLRGQVETAGPAAGFAAPRNRDREIRLSGEAGLAFFDGGAQSAWPHAEFRADDVKVYLEAPVWRDTYFFAELDLVIREANDEYFHMGEVYVDFENVSGRLGGPDRLVNLRVGRFDIPFGEEYLVRGVMDNPLVSHSVADLWGIDEGLGIYGEAAAFNYVIAVQNGGRKTLNDFDADKSVTARLSTAPAPWLQLSASAMRTGRLTVAGDALSEMWIGGGFFRSIGNAATTQHFSARMMQLDAAVRWKSGHFKAAIGRARYEDDDTLADNRRRLKFHSLEAMQHFGDRIHGAVRYSELRVNGGYPLAGQGDAGTFFFRGLPLTERLSRLSLGLGYRLGDPLLLKFEYSLEAGRMINGQRRDQEDMFSSILGLSF